MRKECFEAEAGGYGSEMPSKQSPGKAGDPWARWARGQGQQASELEGRHMPSS